MEILLASSNPHKIAEITAVWNGLVGKRTFELIGPDALDRSIRAPIEDQPTFEANALLKARHYAHAANMVCLADDSGLEVDVLDGRPGVKSARFAGITGPRDVVDPANNRLLIEQLGELTPHKRSARFVCAMALVYCDHRSPVIVRGTLEGRILTCAEAGPQATGCGENGFGYDPIFLVPHLRKTTAELSAQEKNAISHRGQAARLMWLKLSAE